MKFSDLPIGAIVTDAKSGIEFCVAGQDHPGYPGTTLVTKYIIGVRSFDAKEPENPDCGNFDNVRDYGNNYYPHSNIHQWLNSDAEDWYSPAHQYDAPPTDANIWYGENPYDQRPGFISGLSADLKNALAEVDVPIAVRISTREDSGGRLETIRAKAFLLSRTEIGYGDELGIAEGSTLELFEHYPELILPVPSPQQIEEYGRAWNPAIEYAELDAPGIFDTKHGWKCWLRSAGSRYSYLARFTHPFFAVSYDKVCIDNNGIRPAVCVRGDAECRPDGEGYVI